LRIMDLGRAVTFAVVLIAIGGALYLLLAKRK
jgi:hypothetical protein